jgi:hypothetical protein
MQSPHELGRNPPAFRASGDRQVKLGEDVKLEEIFQASRSIAAVAAIASILYLAPQHPAAHP